MMNSIAKIFLSLGLIFILISIIIWALGFIPIKIGRLPGDIYIEGKSGSFYFPIVTSIIISLILTLLLNLILFFINFFHR